MSNVRCSQCSLANFATASTCKRCGASLESAEGNNWGAASDNNYGDAFTPPTEMHPAFQYHYSNAAPQQASGSHSKKTAAIIVAAVLCIVAAVSIPFYLKSGKSAELANLSWRDYQSDDGSFSVLMPGEPKHMTAGRGPVQMQMTGVELGKQTAFVVIYADLPAAYTDMPVDRVYDSVMQIMARRQEMVVLGQRKISLNGYSGLEVDVKPPADKSLAGTGAFRIFLVPPKLYIVGVGGPDSPEMTAAKIKFLDSFQLLKK